MSDKNTCNDAVLELLREKLQDILKIQTHALEDISNVCVEREVIEKLRSETEDQIVLLEQSIKDIGK